MPAAHPLNSKTLIHHFIPSPSIPIMTLPALSPGLQNYIATIAAIAATVLLQLIARLMHRFAFQLTRLNH
jgi:hypothetical protein